MGEYLSRITSFHRVNEHFECLWNTFPSDDFMEVLDTELDEKIGDDIRNEWIGYRD